MMKLIIENCVVDIDEITDRVPTEEPNTGAYTGMTHKVALRINGVERLCMSPNEADDLSEALAEYSRMARRAR